MYTTQRTSFNRTLLLTFCLLILTSTPGAAQSEGTGVGIILGDPTGLNLKFWTGGRTAIDVAAAWSFRGESALHIHGDYLLHNDIPQKANRANTPFTPLVYFGIGARLKAEEEDKLGMRIPLGLDFIFKRAPLDIYIEAVPLLDLTPGTEFDLNAAAGIRYYF